MPILLNHVLSASVSRPPERLRIPGSLFTEHVIPPASAFHPHNNMHGLYNPTLHAFHMKPGMPLADHSFWLGNTFPYIDSLRAFLERIASNHLQDRNTGLGSSRTMGHPFSKEWSELELFDMYGFSEVRRIRIPDGHEIILVADAAHFQGESLWIEHLFNALEHRGQEVPLEFNVELTYDRRLGVIPARLFYALDPEQQIFVLEHEMMALRGVTHTMVVDQMGGTERHEEMVRAILTRLESSRDQLQDSNPFVEDSWNSFLQALTSRKYHWREDRLSEEEWRQAGLHKTHQKVMNSSIRYGPERSRLREFYATFLPIAKQLLAQSEAVAVAIQTREGLPDNDKPIVQGFKDFFDRYKAWAIQNAGSLDEPAFSRLYKGYADGFSQTAVGLAISVALTSPSPELNLFDLLEIWRANFEHIRRYSHDLRTTPGVTLHIAA